MIGSWLGVRFLGPCSQPDPAWSRRTASSSIRRDCGAPLRVRPGDL